ncbi:MAG: nucleotidyl transferase AbiEii/AbiGii toxin family protein [Candidatus Marinimicrobia bacterium]|nr:nucleotidyl transferase AbiEii/AbiGii toxin family protein [Candidatus Neomarinimicrobiota bacterium]
MNRLIFHGGTALRILHKINRFSEDLDFHLEYQNSKSITIKELDSLKQGLELAGYQISLKKQVEKIVQSVFIKFERLLYDAGLSPNKNEKLNVKIEIDTNPPEGFQTETTLINKYFPFAVRHHDLPTFFL